MRRSLPHLFVAVSACLLLLSSAASAEKKKGKAGDGDQTLDGQMAWEKKVMGDDNGKKAEMKRIAAAQKMAEEARKNPPPEPAPKVKDPNKEGVRAKQEASIGLPTDTDQNAKAAKRPAMASASASAKKAEKPNSANDELGALVASSLAEDNRNAAAGKSAEASDKGGRKGHAAKGKKGRSTASASEPSSLDKMFANANK